MRKFAAAILSVFIFITQAAPASDFRFSPRPNKAGLIHWRQWGRDPFSEAKVLQRPVLLALSAVWCHWCHVMDETTYSGTDVIAYINENFIPVRVDADMRPDIDSLYNQGGWPSTLVLTPEGNIVRGGTYIPLEDMVSWLKKGVAAFRADGRGIGEKREKGLGQAGEATLKAADLKRTVGSLWSAFDRQHGGFGMAQKFPNPEAIDFLLSEYTRSGDEETKEMITVTLDRMEAGGIHDDIGGGFFRYATRPDWSSPHYEKLLDLNAGLAKNYASASLALGKDGYRKVLDGTIGYIMNHLYDRKTGVFYGSQDADEEYYTAKRREGAPPRVDPTIYAGPNAQMITALVAASGATGSKEYLEQAKKAAVFMIRNLYSEKKGVYRYYREGDKHLAGLLADNVLFGSALVDLYNATGDRRYIDTARDVARLLAGKFFDSQQGSFSTSIETTLIGPSEPGGLMEYNAAVSNLRAAVFLLRISGYREDVKLKELAARAIARTKDDCGRIGPAAGFCGTAFEWQLREPLEIVIITVGGPERFLAAVNGIYVPRKVVKVFSLKKDEAAIARLGYPPRESLYLCAEKKCFAAVTGPREVAAEVRKYMVRLKEEK
ncbi:MAG: thioredoxin domain-containing protein [Thermodesulfovibrionales bacterium]